MNALYRIGESRRNQIDFTYAAYHRSGQAILGEEINIGDVTVPVGANVETVFNFDITRSTYSYAFLQDDRIRIAVGAGIYILPIKYSIAATTLSGEHSVEGADVTLPLPALALRGDFLLVHNLYLTASLDAMYLEISNFKGSLYDVSAWLYLPDDLDLLAEAVFVYRRQRNEVLRRGMSVFSGRSLRIRDHPLSTANFYQLARFGR